MKIRCFCTNSLLCLSMLCVLACTRRVSEIAINSQDKLDHYQVSVAGEFSLPNVKAPDSLYLYIPGKDNPMLSQIKKLRVNLHFLNTSDSSQNYTGTEAVQFARNLIHNANTKLRENAKMTLPHNNNTKVLPAMYRYEICSSSDSDVSSGIYMHYDDDLYYFLNKGPRRNNFSQKVIKKYAIGMDSIINIFLMPHHRDSVISKSYQAFRSGIALGNAVKIAIRYDNKEGFWSYGGLLNHEIGHILGLRHSWNENDGCEDTPRNPNCWNKTDEPPCDELVSNNMMDYNVSQSAITPCQLEKIHKNLSLYNSRLRRNLLKTWCQTSDLPDLVIDSNTIWYADLDLEQGILIKSGSYLIISSRVSLPSESAITIEPGGRLILHNALLHNDCGKLWKGIILKNNKLGKTQLQIWEPSIIKGIYPDGTIF